MRNSQISKKWEQSWISFFADAFCNISLRTRIVKKETICYFKRIADVLWVKKEKSCLMQLSVFKSSLLWWLLGGGIQYWISHIVINTECTIPQNTPSTKFLKSLHETYMKLENDKSIESTCLIVARLRQWFVNALYIQVFSLNFNKAKKAIACFCNILIALLLCLLHIKRYLPISHRSTVFTFYITVHFCYLYTIIFDVSQASTQNYLLREIRLSLFYCYRLICLEIQMVINVDCRYRFKSTFMLYLEGYKYSIWYFCVLNTHLYWA